MKKANPSMFAWEIRDYLRREIINGANGGHSSLSALDASSIPSISSINRILRSGSLPTHHHSSSSTVSSNVNNVSSWRDTSPISMPSDSISSNASNEFTNVQSSSISHSHSLSLAQGSNLIRSSLSQHQLPNQPMTSSSSNTSTGHHHHMQSNGGGSGSIGQISFQHASNGVSGGSSNNGNNNNVNNNNNNGKSCRRKYSSYHIEEILKQETPINQSDDEDQEQGPLDQATKSVLMQPLSVDVSNSLRINSVIQPSTSNSLPVASSSLATSPQQQFYYSYYYQALLAHYQGSASRTE